MAHLSINKLVNIIILMLTGHAILKPPGQSSHHSFRLCPVLFCGRLSIQGQDIPAFTSCHSTFWQLPVNYYRGELSTAPLALISLKTVPTPFTQGDLELSMGGLQSINFWLLLGYGLKGEHVLCIVCF